MRLGQKQHVRSIWYTFISLVGNNIHNSCKQPYHCDLLLTTCVHNHITDMPKIKLVYTTISHSQNTQPYHYDMTLFNSTQP